ncbi:hypothetical protein BX600DRAFT_512322 [Xylariales sp. PMI_506]|nr:hypothetical protein BX600DRAFT_512322 [Xylariales sp. PMI_506]
MSDHERAASSAQPSAATASRSPVGTVGGGGGSCSVAPSRRADIPPHCRGATLPQRRTKIPIDQQPQDAKPAIQCPWVGCKAMPRNVAELKVHQRQQGHYVCGKCEREFRNESILRNHMDTIHALEQSLTCPGCGAEFTRVGGLMQHVEDHQCNRITPEMLQMRRQKAMEFDQALRKLNMANETVVMAGELGKLTLDDGHRPHTQPGSCLPNSPFVLEPLREYRSGDSREPDLLTGDKVAKHAAIKSQGRVRAHYQPLQASKVESGLELQDRLPPRPLGRQVVKYVETSNSPKTATNSREHVKDPELSGFDVAVFYDPILEKYKCPFKLCTAKFMKPFGLQAHLNSPTHKPTIIIECPICHRTFRSMAAAMQHCERATRTCSIRDSDAFRGFVHDVTGGLLDGSNAVGDCFPDGTPRFFISNIFLEDLPFEAFVGNPHSNASMALGQDRMTEGADDVVEDGEEARLIEDHGDTRQSYGE